MQHVVLYIHGKGGGAAEAAHYGPLFPFCEVVGLDYKNSTPRKAAAEIRAAVRRLKKAYDTVILIANSIGAFYAMHAGVDDALFGAYFISPIVDMERLILDRMRQAGVTEDRLRAEQTVAIGEEEPLSWNYLCFVRSHPVRWAAPTDILYGEKDALTDIETMRAFAAATGATLTVMPQGEHWFHTAKQMCFLNDWITASLQTRQTAVILQAEPEQRAQLQRIAKYETLMREAQALLAAGDCGAALGEKLAALEAYYTSDAWKRDFADDEAGLLPPDLRRGVLSEDGIYNLLEQYRDR